MPAYESADRELVITRIVDAPRQVVFTAWTDPERLKYWWGPKDFTNPVCELDDRHEGHSRSGAISQRFGAGKGMEQAGTNPWTASPKR